MSRNYKIQDNEKAYFVTFTVINWIDVFIRNEYRNVFIDSLKYCQEHKGLNIYAWCLMTSHAHLIVSSNEGLPLAGIIRDTKSYTSRHIRKLLEDKDAVGESRREWRILFIVSTFIKSRPNSFKPISTNSNIVTSYY